MQTLQDARFGFLFGSPVFHHVWSDAAQVNAQLRASILDQEREHPGKALSNYGGWHSETGALEFCGDAGRRLIDYTQRVIEEATRRLYSGFGRAAAPLSWKISAWANVNRRGHYNDLHTHPGATWSAVYFIDSGESDPTSGGTPLELFDPNPARTVAFFPDIPASNMTFKPEPGLMVMFPSYLPHAVAPHQGDLPRISIALNIRKEPFP